MPSPPAKRPPPPLNFPSDGGAVRSSALFAKQALAASLRATDAAAADAVLNEKDLRMGYPAHIVANVKACAASATAAERIAADGLAFLHSSIELTKNGTATPLSEAMALYGGRGRHAFETGGVVGGGHRSAAEGWAGGARARLAVPRRGAAGPGVINSGVAGEGDLEGAELLAALRRLAARGTVEGTVPAALEALARHPEWLDLSGRVFVVIGAGAAMGPTKELLAAGAHVIALDLPRPAIWERLIAMGRASPGTLSFPMRSSGGGGGAGWSDAERAGVDLLAEAPEIANWLLEQQPGKLMTVGTYAYADGGLHVLCNVAADAIMARLLAERPGTSLSFLCSPTDVFSVPRSVREEQRRRFAARPFPQLAALGVRNPSGSSTLFEPNDTSTVGFADEADLRDQRVCIVDGIVIQQGFNYALGKRLQHWRAILAQRSSPVSSNVAPASWTPSVLSNAIFRTAYSGVAAFKPIELMMPEEASALMTLLLIRDLSDPASATQRAVRGELGSQLELFEDTACHGGMWRVSVKVRSIVEVSALIAIADEYGPRAVGAVGAAMYAVSKL